MIGAPKPQREVKVQAKAEPMPEEKAAATAATTFKDKDTKVFFEKEDTQEAVQRQTAMVKKVPRGTKELMVMLTAVLLMTLLIIWATSVEEAAVTTRDHLTKMSILEGQKEL